MRSSLLVAALLVVTRVHSASAEDQQREYTVYGYGLESCSFWVEHRKQKNLFRAAAQEWVSGFVSGIGAVGYFDLAKTNNDAMYAFIDKYCEENPSATLVHAANELGLSLASDALKEETAVGR